MYDNTFEVKYKWILDYLQFCALPLVKIKVRAEKNEVQRDKSRLWHIVLCMMCTSVCLRECLGTYIYILLGCIQIWVQAYDLIYH